MDEVLKIGIQIPRDQGMGTDILTHWGGEGRSVLQCFSERGPGDHILAEVTRKTKPVCV